jgi:hypothetical protein
MQLEDLFSSISDWLFCHAQTKHCLKTSAFISRTHVECKQYVNFYYLVSLQVAELIRLRIVSCGIRLLKQSWKTKIIRNITMDDCVFSSPGSP